MHKDEIMGHTKECYRNLENAGAVTELLQEKFIGEKVTGIALEIIASGVKNAQKAVINIQNEIQQKL